MKEVGFFRNHEDNDSYYYLNHFLDSNNRFTDINIKVIDYLEKGIHFCNWMYIDIDEDGTVIGPNIYRTDGKWIWPDYFLYYLKKYVHSMIVEYSFIDYLNEIDFVFPYIDQIKLQEAYAQYINPVKVSVPTKEKQIFKMKR